MFAYLFCIYKYTYKQKVSRTTDRASYTSMQAIATTHHFWLSWVTILLFFAQIMWSCISRKSPWHKDSFNKWIVVVGSTMAKLWSDKQKIIIKNIIKCSSLAFREDFLPLGWFSPWVQYIRICAWLYWIKWWWFQAYWVKANEDMMIC